MYPFFTKEQKSSFLSFKDIKTIFDGIFFSNPSSELFSINNNESITIRNYDAKIGYNIHEEGNSIYNDIIFLKMLKERMVVINFLDFSGDLNSDIGRQYYKFIDKFSFVSEIIFSTEKGKTEYKIQEIVDNHFDEFINYIEIITQKDIERDKIKESFDIDDYFYDVLTLIVNINFGDFLKKISLYLSKLNNLPKSKLELIKNSLFNKFNTEDNKEIRFPYEFYLSSYSEVYQILTDLEQSGKLRIDNIYFDTSYNKLTNMSSRDIVFEISKFLNNYHDSIYINLDRPYHITNIDDVNSFENTNSNLLINIKETSFDDKGGLLKYNGETLPFNIGDRPYLILKRLYQEKDIKVGIDTIELYRYIEDTEDTIKFYQDKAKILSAISNINRQFRKKFGPNEKFLVFKNSQVFRTK